MKAHALAVTLLVGAAIAPTSTTALDAAPARHRLPACSGVVNQQCRSVGDHEPIVDPCNVPAWVDRRTARSYSCHRRSAR